MTKLTEFTQLLRDRLPLSTVIARFISLKKKGREYWGLCPFHQEKGPSFTVNDEKGFFHCFGCGAHGDVFNFIMQHQNLLFMEAVEYLAEQANLTVPSFSHKADIPDNKETQDTLYALMETACKWYEAQLRHPSAEFVRSYLKNRSMTGEIAKKFRLGYAPETGLKEFLCQQGWKETQLLQAGLVSSSNHQNTFYDRFRNRVIFPIQDMKGRVIAFGGRIIHSGEPKYLNSPDTPLFHKGRQLYALHHGLSLLRKGTPLVVVEGYMDVISLHQQGFETAVAPLGTAVTIEQLHLMWRRCSTPVFCFDGDEAGQRAAERIAFKALEVLQPGYSLSFCFLEKGEDPDSYLQKYGSAAFQQILEKSVPLNEVVWYNFIRHHTLSTPEQKAKARQEIFKLTQSIQDLDTQHFYRQDFNERLYKMLRSHGPIGNKAKQPIERLVSTVPNQMKKMTDGQKILLATLINHPPLVAQLSEQLMSLTFSDEVLINLCQKLLDICSAHPHIEVNNLKEHLQHEGFTFILEQLLHNEVYHKARFAHPSMELKQAYEGWIEVWKTMQEDQHLKQEVFQTAAQLSSNLDEQGWQRLKFLKKTLVVQKTN